MPNRSSLSLLLFAVLLSVGCSGALNGTGASRGDPAGAADRIRFPDGSGGLNQAEHLDAPYVVLLSLDGFRYDYPDIFETPNLHRIISGGVRSQGLIPVFPVKTFPNHYSIATGMYADSHGIVGNRFYEPDFGAYYSIADRAAVEDGRWYGGEPIWVTAETQGMVSASYFWVGTEAPVMGIQPTEWSRFDPTVPYENRVDRVIEWLGRRAESRPHMITLYFEETDNVGHNVPPDSPEMIEAVGLVDRMIGRLLDGIEALPHGDEVHIVVVSDHGMGAYFADQTYFVPDLIDLGEGVEMVEAGPHMIMYVDGDDARKDQLRDDLAAALPNVTVFRVGNMPERLHYASAGARLGDLTLMPDFGWSVLPWSASERSARSGWTHGWDRNTLHMQGLFAAKGPRIVEGVTIPAFENVHIYSLLAEVLRLDPNPEVDGRLEVLAGVLR